MKGKCWQCVRLTATRMVCHLLWVVGIKLMICQVGCAVLLCTSSVWAQQQPESGTVAPPRAADPSSSASTRNGDVSPISAKERINWVIKGTIGPESLAAGLFSAAWGTGFDEPKIYGPHWDGYGKRYGMRFTGIATSDAMEAGLGTVWGEDPRYRRDADAPFVNRLGHAAKMTFFANNRDGGVRIAYARFIAIPGSNFLSNAWRAPGDDTAGNAAVRVGLGFLGRFGSNAFDEFWPDVKQKVFHRGE